MTDSYQKNKDDFYKKRHKVLDPIFGKTWVKEKISSNQNKELHKYFCNKPFSHFEAKEDGKVHLCCPSYLPFATGNLNEKSIDEVFNGPQAIELRKSILRGDFKYCSRACPSIQNNTLPPIDWILENPDDSRGGQSSKDIEIITKARDKGIDKLTDEDLKIPLPIHINLSADKSCNLHCPSCRVKKIDYKSGIKFNRAKELNDKIVEAFLTKPTNREFSINCAGSGDPFASKIYRNMLYNINGNDFPNLKIDIQTNGLLFTKTMWNKLHKIH